MRRRDYLKEYIASLEKEFSLIENGFKEEEKRALADYKSNDNEYAKNLLNLARYKFLWNETYKTWLTESETVSTFRKRPIFRKNTFLKESIWKVPKSLGPLVVSSDRYITKVSEKALGLSSQHKKSVIFV